MTTNRQCNPSRLDAALDREAEPTERAWASRHLRECTSCEEYARQRGRFDAMLESLPQELSPERELWSSIEAALALPPSVGAPTSRPLSVFSPSAERLHRARGSRATGMLSRAAAVLIFAVGVATGSVLTSARSATPATVAAPADLTPNDESPAEAVQRLGTALTAALTRVNNPIDSTAISAGEPQEQKQEQEQEVALATMRGAVAELVRIAPGQPSIARAYESLSAAHRRLGVRGDAPPTVPF